MGEKKVSLLDLLFALLRFMNLLDRGNMLSITNIAVVVCVFKVATSLNPSLAEVGALMLSLLNYGHKRFEGNVSERHESIKADVTKFTVLQNQIDNIKHERDEITKITEEARKLISTSKLSAALNPFSKN